MWWLALLVALADDPTEVRRHPDATVEPELPTPKSGFSFLGLVQARFVGTNIVTTSPLLDGQIVGQLGGINGTITSEEKTAWYAEQRVNGFFTYRPPILDRRVGLTAGFEIDFGFGDAAYGVTGNKGGGFGADQVNIQTRRLHVDVRALDKPRHTLDLRLGQQFLADTARDPALARPDDLFRTGGGLRFFGSDAAGLQAFGAVKDASGVRVRYRLGAFSLWEQGSGEFDDTTLFLADADLNVGNAGRIGVHGWYLNDDSNGTGGFFGVGPTSQLAELQGAARLDLRESDDETAPRAKADLGWVGLDASYNHGLAAGPFGVTGGAFLQTGRISALATDTDDRLGWLRVLGMLAHGEARVRFAPGRGSVARLGAMFSTADNLDTADYGGVLTGNSYGIVGAIYAAHGTVLLHPDLTAINRQSAVVYDVSGAGNGVIAAQAAVGYDLVPNRVNLMVTAAHASSARLDPLGTELNLRLDMEPFLFFRVSVTGAVVLGTQLDVNPWTAYANLQWVVF